MAADDGNKALSDLGGSLQSTNHTVFNFNAQRSALSRGVQGWNPRRVTQPTGCRQPDIR